MTTFNMHSFLLTYLFRLVPRRESLNEENNDDDDGDPDNNSESKMKKKSDLINDVKRKSTATSLFVNQNKAMNK